MTSLQTRGLFFDFETYGVSSHPAMLLIRGLGSQIIDWPKTLIDGLVAAGLLVVVFDNRDAGLSQKMSDPADHAYRISDMAQDCLDILDTLGIQKAHLLGLSMGGMITQYLLAHTQDRLETATIVMSGICDASLKKCLDSDLPLEPPEPDDDVEVFLAHALDDDAIYEGPAFPIPREERAQKVRQRFERSYCPEGQLRQLAAVRNFQLDARDLAGCKVPTLVINGDCDPIFPAVQGEKIASSLENANFHVIPGMGHELSDDLGALIADHVVKHIWAGNVERVDDVSH